MKGRGLFTIEVATFFLGLGVLSFVIDNVVLGVFVWLFCKIQGLYEGSLRMQNTYGPKNKRLNPCTRILVSILCMLYSGNSLLRNVCNPFAYLMLVR